MAAADQRKRTHQHLDELPGLAAATYGDWPIWRYSLPFPTSVMMGSSGTHQLETYLVVGSSWWQVVAQHLPERGRVLDIGCGCAKLARFLAVDPRVQRYTGFDPIRDCIDWCSRFIAPATDGRFEFVHIDLYSGEYNPRGTVRAAELSFPAADGSIDVAVAASLFTHLLEADACRYLAEAARVLAPQGVLILSLHTEPAAGTRYSGDEARIDVDKEYFLSLAEAAGLQLQEDLGSLCGQDALVLRRRTGPSA